MCRKMFLMIALFTTSLSYSIDYKAIPGNLLGVVSLPVGLYNCVYVISLRCKTFDFDVTESIWESRRRKVETTWAYGVAPLLTGFLNFYYANSTQANSLGVKHIAGSLVGVAAMCTGLFGDQFDWYLEDHPVNKATRGITSLLGLTLLYYANQCLLSK